MDQVWILGLMHKEIEFFLNEIFTQRSSQFIES